MTTRNPVLERLTRLESKLSQLMEAVGVNPRNLPINARVYRDPRDRVVVSISSLGIPLGEILSTAHKEYPNTKSIYVVHRENDVCTINSPAKE